MISDENSNDGECWRKANTQLFTAFLNDASGYSGDEEGADGDSSSSSGSRSSMNEEEMIKSWQCASGRQRFFRLTPRKRRRGDSATSVCSSPIVPKMRDTTASTMLKQYPTTTSMYVFSRWLGRYFLDQEINAATEITNTSPNIPTNVSIALHAGKNEMMARESCYSPQKLLHRHPSILSHKHQCLEDALSFSPLPRILVEADAPHRVVHANAAYARLSRVTANKTHLFAVPQGSNVRDLEAAVMTLFEPSSSLTMYPVWGSDVPDQALRFITHYLVESGGENNNAMTDHASLVNLCYNKEDEDGEKENNGRQHQALGAIG